MIGWSTGSFPISFVFKIVLPLESRGHSKPMTLFGLVPEDCGLVMPEYLHRHVINHHLCNKACYRLIFEESLYHF
jgi:hypothetical protein